MNLCSQRGFFGRIHLGAKCNALSVALVCAGIGALCAEPATPASPVSAEHLATIQVRVNPDRAGWTYAVGERVRFHIEVTADREMLVGAKVSYAIGPEMIPATENVATIVAGGLDIDGGTMQEPGFLRCVAKVERDGKTYKGLATAGFSPERITPTQKDPDDFDAFWTLQRDQAAKIPLEPRMTLQPDLCTSKVNVYHISIQNTGTGVEGSPTRIYGMLCVPKGDGSFPAVLRVPGAGVRPYRGWVELAAEGVITLEIGIHGIPVNLPDELYTALRGGALSEYRVNALDDRDRYFFRRVYIGCLRANDFLCGLPQYDGKNLAVMGGSQGGQLAIVTAALDPRVKALVSLYPAYSDVTGYLHDRAGGWPHMMQRKPDGSASPQATPAKIATTGYYDTVNFARRLKVPGCYSWGYNDEVCPPTTTFAAYNVIRAPKQLLLTLELGHSSIPEQTERVQQWLLAQLKAQRP